MVCSWPAQPSIGLGMPWYANEFSFQKRKEKIEKPKPPKKVILVKGRILGNIEIDGKKPE